MIQQAILLDGCCYYHTFGCALLQQGKPSSALANIQHALTLQPDDLPAQTQLAATQIRQGDYSISEQALSKILQQDPQQALAQQFPGDVFLYQRQLDAAKLAYIKTVALAANNLAALNNLGIIACQENRLAEASAYFKQAITAHPDAADPSSNLGNVYKIQHQPEQA